MKILILASVLAQTCYCPEEPIIIEPVAVSQPISPQLLRMVELATDVALVYYTTDHRSRYADYADVTFRKAYRDYRTYFPIKDTP